MPRAAKVEVHLEVGKKRTFAGAIEWPGWCRSGRDADSALQALFEYGPRYSAVVRPRRLGFSAPREPSGFTVVERLKGDATTDFGAPSRAPASDKSPLDAAEARRFRRLMEACWAALDSAAASAGSKTLRKGPRGGGRDLDAIVEHVVEADAGYLRLIDVKLPSTGGPRLKQVRGAILQALDAAPESGPVKRGPRGGVRWTHRYFVRRSAWHVLDHAWEIEDRAGGG
jgi:hypothetical protein